MDPASSAVEQTSVAPAITVANNPNAKPPIQKNGELQNNTSPACRPRMALRLRWCVTNPPWVWTAPLGGPVDPEV